MRTRLGLIGIAIQCATDRVGRVSIIIDHQIRMPYRAVEPAVDLLPVLFDRRANCALGTFAICPRRCGGDIALVTESLSKFSVGASNVFAERVAARRFIL
jgi:hypothetical protein